MFNDLEPKVDKIAQTMKELPANKKIVKIMEFALALGNYLNGSSARGGAWGFKLD
jgi:diaphanous 1